MPTAAVEDYVKTIYVLERDSPAGKATVAGIASILGVTKGSVAAMLSKLKKSRLIEGERYGGVCLTSTGKKLALDVLRRHRLIELFLVETLQLKWSEVHAEAERLEHAVSTKVLDRLDAFLRHPQIDPQGDPIPDANGKTASLDGILLSKLNAGDKGVILRISDQDSGFLEFIERHHLRPETHFSVVEVVPEAQLISLKVGGKQKLSLSLEAAGKILVKRLNTRNTRGT
jgi:DtxR family Mn-dependent transcriptional regulator